MAASALSELEEKCRNIQEEGKSFLSWSWDDWLEGALSTFQWENEEKVLEILEKHFTACWFPKTLAFWDPARISRAPKSVKKIAEMTGGLKKDQMIFSTDADKDVVMIGAWWPWDDGDTTSLRIALIPQQPDLPHEEMKEIILDWFDLSEAPPEE